MGCFGGALKAFEIVNKLREHHTQATAFVLPTKAAEDVVSAIVIGPKRTLIPPFV